MSALSRDRIVLLHEGRLMPALLRRSFSIRASLRSKSTCTRFIAAAAPLARRRPHRPDRNQPVRSRAHESISLQYGSEIGTLTLEHLWLTAAPCCGPRHRRACGHLAHAVARWQACHRRANILQTIPSLALFGFYCRSWLAIAPPIAIVASPHTHCCHLRNTYTGILALTRVTKSRASA